MTAYEQVCAAQGNRIAHLSDCQQAMEAFFFAFKDQANWNDAIHLPEILQPADKDKWLTGTVQIQWEGGGGKFPFLIKKSFDGTYITEFLGVTYQHVTGADYRPLPVGEYAKALSDVISL